MLEHGSYLLSPIAISVRLFDLWEAHRESTVWRKPILLNEEVDDGRDCVQFQDHCRRSVAPFVEPSAVVEDSSAVHLAPCVELHLLAIGDVFVADSLVPFKGVCADSAELKWAAAIVHE
jgi:hypothetical protein